MKPTLALLLLTFLSIVTTAGTRPALAGPVSRDLGSEVDAYIQETMRRLPIPGLAVGIVQGDQVARNLLALPDPPTGLVCASDSLALGALRAVRALDRPVAVTGFDDTPVAEAVGLTSVSQPLGRAAARCMDLLTRILDGPRGDGPHQVLLKPTLVVRQTA